MRNYRNDGYISDSKISRLLDDVFKTARNSGYSGEDYCRELSRAFFDLGMIETFWRDGPEGRTLRDGSYSPYYINLRRLTSYPDSDKLLAMIGLGVKKKIEEDYIEIDRIAGAAFTGIIIANAATNWGKIPSCWNRKIEGVKTVEQLDEEIKRGDYRRHHLMEGILLPGERIMIWDDVVTKGGTKFIVKRQAELEQERRKRDDGIDLDLELKHVGVIIDREQGGEKTLREGGLKLHSLMTFSQCLEWLKDKMHPYEHEMIAAFHRDDEEFQDPRLQKQLEEEARANSPFFAARRIT